MTIDPKTCKVINCENTIPTGEENFTGMCESHQANRSRICPACNSDESRPVSAPFPHSIRECDMCDARFGRVGYEGELYKWLSSDWRTNDLSFRNTRYVDFTYIGSTGPARFHGWIDRDSGKIVQVG